MTAFWCRHAWLDGAVADRVRVVVDGGRISSVVRDVPPAAGDERLEGLALPGFANAHSHAFHRALRGRTHDGSGTFWTWRRRMYRVAARLEPDSYLALARATYAEMALAGVTCVGEFHYLHHAGGGRPYAEPNVMGEALIEAASQAGIRLTLLDTCYLVGGLEADGHMPLDDVQRRFSDGDVDAWAGRAAQLTARGGVRAGAAIHSVRAVPAEQLSGVVEAAADRPLHVHLSEQEAENRSCQEYYGRTPTAVLAQAGVWGPRTTAVHATRVAAADIPALGGTGTSVCACPSTEADLADGVGPFRRLHDGGSPVCLGSDQHAVVDPLGEAHLLEHHERLVSGERGRFAPATLVEALTTAGHRALGWPDAGRIAAGQRGDLVAVRLDSVRTAGIEPAQVAMVARAPDIHAVVVDGRMVVREGRHVLGNVGTMLAEAIAPLWEDGT